MYNMRVESAQIPHLLLEVEQQPEVGEEAYDQGAQILNDFFRDTISVFLGDGLSDLGRQIIQCCLDGGTVQDYEAILPMENRESE